MRSTLITGFLFLQFFCACSSGEGDAGGPHTAESDVDAARSFIRSALDGKYDRARQFIVQDSVNTQYLDLFERNYQLRMDPEDKRGYRESSINIHGIRQLNDSVTVVNYSNSFKKQNDSLKVVRMADRWLVDLKYSFSPTDTVQ
jgi:type IV secretory pathway component VirB8